MVYQSSQILYNFVLKLKFRLLFDRNLFVSGKYVQYSLVKNLAIED